MTSTGRALLSEIEAFLAATGVTPTKFGIAAVNDGHLVGNLRKGSSVTLKTADRVRAYMDSERSDSGDPATDFEVESASGFPLSAAAWRE